MNKFLLIFLLFAGFSLMAQDLENLEIKPPKVQVSGNISAGLRFFNSDRPNLFNNSTFGYLGSARVNVKIGQFVLPFSYRLGDQLNLPDIPSFQYWGLSPRYKGLTVHLGHRSNRFTENTLNNIQQYGIGATQKIKDFTLQVSRGVLNRERFGRMVYNTSISPLRERPYTAASAGYKKGHNEVTLAILAARETPNATDTVARKNRVFELIAGKAITEKLRIKVNASGSYTERDRAALFPLFDEEDWLVQTGESLGGTPNLTTRTGLLLDADAGYYGKSFNLSAGFRQVDSGYETFGRNFQLNDLRAYTIKTGVHLFNHSLLFNARVGIEQNNIREQRVSRTERIITNANLSYRSKSNSGFQINVSNFNLDRINQFIVGRDSFDFSYQSLTITATPFIQAGRSQISASLNYVLNDNDQQTDLDNRTQFYFGQLNFSHAKEDQTLRFQVGVNGYYTSTSEIEITTLGGYIGLFGNWLEKQLRLNLRYNPNRRLSETNPVWTHLLHGDARYQINKKSSVFLQHYTQIIVEAESINENQTRLGYSLNF
ncbi:MAG: hypothetical protein AAFN81_15475 [Bacteroidota bacterium]